MGSGEQLFGNLPQPQLWISGLGSINKIILGGLLAVAGFYWAAFMVKLEYGRGVRLEKLPKQVLSTLGLGCA